MALFIFGAGATRGSSFVNPSRYPCLPPLDSDFFTQLQKVQNPKHQPLIKRVMEDVVDLFGPNFDVTMETVFATLEHTIRMLETTGENRAFKRRELVDRRNRLVQSIAVVLEGSLCRENETGRSSQTPRSCKHHNKFVKDILQPGDDLITFNYDCTLDRALFECGNRKWNPRYGYGFTLGARGRLLSGDEFWSPERPATRRKTAHLYKLHGSLHFLVSQPNGDMRVKLKQRPYTKQMGNLKFTIIPPESQKAYDKGVFAKLWKEAAVAMREARHIVVIGYSLPHSDLHSTALFRTAIREDRLQSLVVVNPDRGARRRIRSILQRGLSRSSRVLSFDYLQEFVATPRRTWEVA